MEAEEGSSKQRQAVCSLRTAHRRPPFDAHPYTQRHTHTRILTHTHTHARARKHKQTATQAHVGTHTHTGTCRQTCTHANNVMHKHTHAVKTPCTLIHACQAYILNVSTGKHSSTRTHTHARKRTHTHTQKHTNTHTHIHARTCTKCKHDMCSPGLTSASVTRRSGSEVWYSRSPPRRGVGRKGANNDAGTASSRSWKKIV